MVSLEHIAVQFGERVLFRDLSVLIAPHSRIGVVGSNGSGKSTLLRIIAGLQQADSGSVMKARYVTVGYLPQDGGATSRRTLYEEVQTAFENILDVQQKAEEAHRRLGQIDPNSPDHQETVAASQKGKKSKFNC